MYILCYEKVNMSLLSINGSPEERKGPGDIAKSLANKNFSPFLSSHQSVNATSEKDAPLFLPSVWSKQSFSSRQPSYIIPVKLLIEFQRAVPKYT